MADSVEKKACPRCTIMNFMMIITAIAVIILMSSCVTPSSIRDGRVIGYKGSLTKEQRMALKKEEPKEDLAKDEDYETFIDTTHLESKIIKEKKAEPAKEISSIAYEETFGSTPKIKSLEDQLKSINRNTKITNTRIDKLQKEILSIKSEINEIRKAQAMNPASTASVGGNDKEEFTLMPDNYKKSDDPIVVTAKSEEKKPEVQKEKLEVNTSNISSSTNFMLAEKYLDKKDYHRAIRELKELEKNLTNEIEKGECRYLLGESHYHLKQYAKAIHYFVKVLENPDYQNRDKAQVMLAESHIKAGESKKAKTVYKTLLEENPRSEYITVARKMLQQL